MEAYSIFSAPSNLVPIVPWAQDGPEPLGPVDSIVDRLQRRLEATDNPTDREVLQLKIMDLLRRCAE